MTRTATNTAAVTQDAGEPIPLHKAEASPAGVPAVTAPTAVAAPTAPVAAKKKGNPRRLVLLIAVPLALAVAGSYFWLTGGRFVDTDNAYVQQAMVAISPDVAGRIVGVEVAENQKVVAGDVLFRLDDEPYRIALSQADAALAQARVGVTQLRAAYASAQAKLTAAQGVADIRERELERQTSLASQGVTAQSALDNSTLAAQAARNDVALAEQGVASAAAALGGDPAIETDKHPSVMAALAAHDIAERNLTKTIVLAPADGIIAQIGNLNVGQFVATGTAIASLVETETSWVEANFKETQLADLSVGQPVDIEVDAYPGIKLHGQVDSIGSATGAEMALIPAQNATGNWVKVVQRVPVRFAVTEEPGHPLRAGMSAHVSVDTGASRLDAML